MFREAAVFSGLCLTQLGERPGTPEEFLKHTYKSIAQEEGDSLASHKYSVTIATTTIQLLPKGVFANVAEEKEQFRRDGGRERLRDKAVTPYR